MKRSMVDSETNILGTDYLGNRLWFLGVILSRKSTQLGRLVYGVEFDVFVEIESILVWF